ncbi:glycosyltransferase family 2 protein [Ruminococcaceae bacterium OttesenSCG-928-A11]|nr:glycosyltransferase family 2 protein [Ruminococcaceae bacterium OttesenSCG-928-A11]
MKLLIVIPAYNEVESLPGVIADLQAHCPQHDYLVVNDGSTDGTGPLCRQNGWNMLDLPVNLGLAGAFQAGLLYAWERGYDAAIQFDADGQHAAEYIQPLLDKLAEGYDIIIGSRFVTVKKPITLRMAGSFIISFAIRLTTGGVKVCDPTAGMRVFSRRVMEVLANNLNYPPEPDTVAYLLRCGAKICEQQVAVRERTAGTSYFTIIKSIKYMAQTTLSILFVQWFRKNDLKKEAS